MRLKGGIISFNKVIVKNEFVNYFKRVFNKEGRGNFDEKEFNNLIIFRLSSNMASSLIGEVMEEENKNVILVMDNNKPLGLDGYDTYFFKQAWDVVRFDMVNAINNFFHYGYLLKEVNCTTLALIPKVSNPSSFKDYRLITCYNTIYKCITKIIANYLKPISFEMHQQSSNGFC